VLTNQTWASVRVPWDRFHAPLRYSAAPARGMGQVKLRAFTGESTAIGLIFVTAAAAMLFTSPTDGNFWWSDAPRHALNGAFVMDFVAAFPWRHPVDWAVQYYARYPALTIGFYPPLFYMIEAGMFALLGVSHFAAQFTVALFVLLLLWATYALSRFLLPRWSAVGASLLFVGAPEVAYWARQVMLEIPAYAALVVAAFFFARYWKTRSDADILLASISLVAAMYIKLTTVFMVLVFGIMAAASLRVALVRERAVMRAAVVGLVGMMPLLFLTYQFGSINVESVAGRRPGFLPRFGLDAWLYYGRLIPPDLGIAATLLSVVGLLSMARFQRGSHERWMAIFLVTWLVVAYVFFSAIALREPRHGLLMLLPLAVNAIVALHTFLPPRTSQAAAMALGAGTFCYSLVFYPPPHVNGYGAVADYVAAHAPANGLVVFNGYRDGNFVFDMRANGERRDLTILRADKMLVQVKTGDFARGVRQSDLSEGEIEALLRSLGADLIVCEPGFWEGLREMVRFQSVLHTSAFERIARFTITGTVSHDDRLIEIYRPTYPVERTKHQLRLEMPMVGTPFRIELPPR
jgi:4-amino-4-deoxy-L-arabinose transferase-like glycosyltransferase